MRKRLPFFLMMLFLWSISCDEEAPVSQQEEPKITITDIDHEPDVQQLLPKLKSKSVNSRVSSLEMTGAFYKYEEPDSGILNYTVPLADDSPEYFENLILFKRDGGFYGYIYRYISDGTQGSDESFRGVLQQFDLEGNQVAEFSVPLTSDSIVANGRKYLCVKSVDQTCRNIYKTIKVTDYPCHCQYDQKTVVDRICTITITQGMCDDLSGGGSSYLGSGTGNSSAGGGGNVSDNGGKSTVVIAPGKNQPYIKETCAHCIENQLKDPCLRNVADKVLDPQLASKYNRLILDMFNKTDKVNLIIRESDAEDMKEPKKKGANGWTEPVESHNGIVDIIIELNAEKLNSNVSQEYIASTIYHEAFHAIVHYFDKDKWFFLQNTPTDDHIAIFYNYLDLIASALQKAYPNLTLREAQGLLLKGMMKYEKDWDALFNKILARKNFTKEQIDIIEKRYESNTSGTSCD